MMYKELVQTVFMYRSDVWVVMEAMLMVIESLQHWVARRIEGKKYGRAWDSKRELQPVKDYLDVEWIWPIKEHIQRRQATIAANISNQNIYELCKSGKYAGIQQIHEILGSRCGREIE